MSKRKILDPNDAPAPVFTDQEQEFITDQDAKTPKPVAKSRNRNITVKDDIWQKIDEFIEKNPSEGSRSGLISRAVVDYMRRKEAEIRNL